MNAQADFILCSIKKFRYFVDLPKGRIATVGNAFDHSPSRPKERGVSAKLIDLNISPFYLFKNRD